MIARLGGHTAFSGHIFRPPGTRKPTMSRALLQVTWAVAGGVSQPDLSHEIPLKTLSILRGLAGKWLGGRDLNPDNVVQSHVSYR
jgi:hypothetical protein